jgi:hypothetical protein
LHVLLVSIVTLFNHALGDLVREGAARCDIASRRDDEWSRVSRKSLATKLGQRGPAVAALASMPTSP